MIQASEYTENRFFVLETGQDTESILEEMQANVLDFVADDLEPYRILFEVRCGYAEDAPMLDGGIESLHSEVGILPDFMGQRTGFGEFKGAEVGILPDFMTTPADDVVRPAHLRVARRGQVFKDGGEFSVYREDRDTRDMLTPLFETVVARAIGPFVDTGRALSIQFDLTVETLS